MAKATAANKPAKPAKKPVKPVKKPVKHAKTPAKQAKNPANRRSKTPPTQRTQKPLKNATLAELLALVGDTADFDELTSIMIAIGKLGTLEAHEALLALIMNPPKVPHAEDIVTNAMDGLSRVYKEHPHIRAMLMNVCKDMTDDARFCNPLIVLSNAAYHDADLLEDRELCELLRKSIGYPNMREANGQAIAMLMKARDSASVPLVVAALDQMGPDDWHRVENIVMGLYEMNTIDADKLAKLRAARARVTKPAGFTQLDKYIERLAERV